MDRPRLGEHLDRGAESRLTLVAAPAGFGKTTMLAQWLATPLDGRSVAWVSLDEGDSRPAIFWAYVIEALQRIVPGAGGGGLPLLELARPPIESILAAVVNDLSATPHEVVLVLDDYHLVEHADIQTGMAYLVDRLPAQVHLVISTRADPPLPLARLRARGELVEVRAADLRFTVEEAAAYLNDVTGLDLSARDIATLETRTEGWIAALQLAALSMRGRDDAAAFIEGFAGDDRYIVDYLVEEVLRRQPAEVTRFLLQTSILERLNGPVCDAVTGQTGGKAMLEALDRGNLFLVRLDDSRRWYRYHHLFADVLRMHLGDQEPDRLPDLHRRASEWYETDGEPVPAVRHALAAGDVERAAGLIELAVPALQRTRREAVIRGWLDAVPADVVRVRPVLAMGFVGALMSGGELGDVERRLRDIEGALDSPSREALVVIDHAEFPRLPAAVEMYRAGLALVAGDRPATIDHARRAIDRTAADDHLIRAGSSALLGLASWRGGDLEAAHRAYSVCVDGLRRAGHLADVLGCSIPLADIRCTQGRLGDALSTYEEVLRLAGEQRGAALRGTADVHVGMSGIAYERDDLAAAARHLVRARELGENTWLPQNPHRWRVAMARILQAEGDRAGALRLLDEAQRVYTADFLPDVRPIPAMRARVLAAQGHVAEAMGWAAGRGLTPDDDVTYLREFEHLTLARVLLARYQGQRVGSAVRDADRLLQRLLGAAEDGGRTGSVIEILILQALSHQIRGDLRGAMPALERALSLAEPEGYARIFVDEGAPMASLLRRAESGYTQRLFVRTPRIDAGPVDQLSPRELDVLRLLASDLDGPGIARELTVSLSTVRTHTKSIYAKLGVNNRRTAVRRAAEFNLLARHR